MQIATNEMSTPTTNANTIREAIRDKISLMPLDRIHGQPTYQSYRNLRKQLAKMCAAIKTGAWGGRHGHLALVLFNGEYQTKTGDPNADTDPQDAPPLSRPSTPTTKRHTNGKARDTSASQ